MDEGERDQEREFLKRMGRRIRDLRGARGLSQEELGFAADRTQHYISQVELGKRNPSTLTMRALCRALGVSLPELFDGV